MKNYFQDANCFPWIKLIPVQIHLKCWYYNSPSYLELRYLPHHFCQIFTWPTKIHLQHNPHHVVHWFLYFVLCHLTMSHYWYWTYQTIYQSKPIEFNIKLCKDHSTLWFKHITNQKAAAKNPLLFLSQFLPPFSTLMCSQNHPYNTH